MKRDYYTTPKPGFISRMLWKAAGADEYILKKATYSDHVKYATLGGIVCSTGIMAALAGGYAFYIIFKERGSAIVENSAMVAESGTDITTVILSIIFGFVWGLIIFNIDRFIVASTGKGDGTEAITWDEFKGAIPRIIMGIIIAITISKPVELRMFETEIDVKLHEKQMEEQAKHQKMVTKIYKPELERIEAEIKEKSEEIKAQKDIYEIKNRDLILEMQGKSRSGRAGKGPVAEENERQRDLAKEELETLRTRNGKIIQELEKAKEAQLSLIKDKEAVGEETAHSLNGLLERIKIAHEIAGFWITLFITLLFMAIELTPIFFKMMLIKSPYDFMNDNVKALMKAEQGIEVKYDFYKDKEGVQRDLVINHQSEKLIREKVKLLQTQADLNEIVLDEWKKKESHNIKKDPSNYIDS